MSEQSHLLMIHGLLGSIDYFSPRRHLGGIDVHTPDLLGYGYTSGSAIDLQRQADLVARHIDSRIGRPTWLLGHSVGGAVAMLAAQRIPGLVAGLISVEGNFTLKDAFWCARIAATPLAQWREQYRVMTGEPEAFLARAGIAADEQRLAWARAMLANQSADTVHGMARSVIQETGAPAYLDTVRAVLARTPVYLLAGERSAGQWDVPDWVRGAARQSLVMPGTGHMMMMEDPAGFCRAVLGMVGSAGG